MKNEKEKTKNKNDNTNKKLKLTEYEQKTNNKNLGKDCSVINFDVENDVSVIDKKNKNNSDFIKVVDNETNKNEPSKNKTENNNENLDIANNKNKTKIKKKKDKNNYSPEHKKYLRSIKLKTAFVISVQIAILVIIFGLWEILVSSNVIDGFIYSSPSRMIATLGTLMKSGELITHALITLKETLLAFFIATGLGFVIAVLLWSNNTLKRILEPYIVVLNSLPKIALGPLIIIWFGAGTKAIVVMGFLIVIIVTIINILNAFLNTDKNTILALESMGANKWQIFTKIVLPSSFPDIISTLKINVGLACFYPTQSLRDNYSVSTQQKVFDTLIPTKSLKLHTSKKKDNQHRHPFFYCLLFSNHPLCISSSSCLVITKPLASPITESMKQYGHCAVGSFASFIQFFISSGTNISLQ